MWQDVMNNLATDDLAAVEMVEEELIEAPRTSPALDFAPCDRFNASGVCEC
jgi:hypothetical protein